MMKFLVRLAYIVILLCIIMNAINIHQSESRPITNKMRYATQDKNLQSLPLTEILELSSASSQHFTSPYINKYEGNQFHEGKFLDEEDRHLLEKFYKETKDSDPFLGDDLSIDNLWKNEGESRMALSDMKDVRHMGDIAEYNTKEINRGGWTFDENLIKADGQKSHEYPNESELNDTTKANYSPTLKLLTSYDPIQYVSSSKQTSQVEQSDDYIGPDNKIVGATLFGRDQNVRPNVSSKSAAEAIKLHDEMLKKPPDDGKVRVRIYYHRAIHDDSKLYGNGPWKYWGHGWGLEFGYDPREHDKDFYQRGYSIERAYGRDFCKNKKNCRKPDPDFFNDPLDAGKYTEQLIKEVAKLQGNQIR